MNPRRVILVFEMCMLFMIGGAASAEELRALDSLGSDAVLSSGAGFAGEVGRGSAMLHASSSVLIQKNVQQVFLSPRPSRPGTPLSSGGRQHRVGNVCATVTHTVRVSVCGAAVATAQHSRVDPGQTTLSVLANTPGVQWFELRDGALVGVPNVSGATFTIPALQRTMIYLGRVTTPCGIIESSPAVIAAGDGNAALGDIDRRIHEYA